MPLSTSYDSISNQLIFSASKLGDFALGTPWTVDSAYAPAPITPVDSAIVNQASSITLVWGTKGIVQSYRLQVSNDASFTSTLVDKSGLTTTSSKMSALTSNATYYWRVNNTNATGISSWSSVRKFIAAASYISIVSPNGGEKLYIDSTYIVRWNTNITDTVRISLINGSDVVSIIDSALVSSTHAYAWQVSSALSLGTNYQIKVASKTNTLYSGLSAAVFTITSSSSTKVADVTGSLPTKFELMQNYPNPFNPTTAIRFGIPEASNVRVTIFNALGQEIALLVNDYLAAGYHECMWQAGGCSSGVYFYKVDAGRNTAIKKMMLIK